MSNVEDSSSLEYLDESQYLEEDDHYTQFLMAPVPPQRHQSKSTASPPSHHFGPSSSSHHHQQEIIAEPEYTEADPGLISGAAAACGTYRSLPDGPVSTSSPAHHPSGLTSTSSLRPRPKESMIPQSSSLYSPVMDRAGPFGLEGFRPAAESSPSLPKSASLQRSPSSVNHLVHFSCSQTKFQIICHSHSWGLLLIKRLLVLLPPRPPVMATLRNTLKVI